MRNTYKKGKYIKLHLDKQESLIKLFYNQSPEMDIDIALKNLSELNFGIPFAHRHTYCEEFYSVNRVYENSIINSNKTY